jgi:hypothetical protein
LEADDKAVTSNGIHEDGCPKRLDGIGNFMCWQGMELPVWQQMDCPSSFVWIAIDMTLRKARPEPALQPWRVFRQHHQDVFTRL